MYFCTDWALRLQFYSIIWKNDFQMLHLRFEVFVFHFLLHFLKKVLKFWRNYFQVFLKHQLDKRVCFFKDQWFGARWLRNIQRVVWFDQKTAHFLRRKLLSSSTFVVTEVSKLAHFVKKTENSFKKLKLII